MTTMHSWMQSLPIQLNLDLQPPLLRTLSNNWSGCLVIPGTMSTLFIKLTTLPLPLLFLISGGLTPLTMHSKLLRQSWLLPLWIILSMIQKRVQCNANTAKWTLPYRSNRPDPSSGSPTMRMVLMMMHLHRRRKAMQLHPRPPSIVLHLYDVVRTICSYGFVICFCIILSRFRFFNATRT